MSTRALASLVVSGVLAIAPATRAQTTFTVTLDPATFTKPVSGRLVVFLVREGNPALKGKSPIEGPFFESPSPMFGIDVKDAAPGSTITIDDHATWFLSKPGDLPAGEYIAQGVLMIDRRRSSWRDESGHFTTPIVKFSAEPRRGLLPGPFDRSKSVKAANAAPKPVALTLSNRTSREAPEAPPGVQMFEVRSKLLSDFHHRDVKLRAGVVLPIGSDPSRKYPAIYEVPGFGGDHTGALGVARDRNRLDEKTPAGLLARNAFWIVLDPESPNGHTLFADSANNGPRGRALVEELLPALEAEFPLIAKPEARLLRGHSSGGWSVVWLSTRYPKTFGGAWSSSPDPVDFHRFQKTDIYAPGANMYSEHDAETPSFRDAQGVVKMTVRQENGMEEVLGPDNTSGQQWDSWQAVFGPRNEQGRPAALYEHTTGEVDAKIAEQYAKYDIVRTLHEQPGVYGPIFLQRVRLVVGGGDSFYLNEAVELLAKELENPKFFDLPEGTHGYVKIVPGRDHGTIFQTPEIAAYPDDMIAHLKRQGLMP
jgi:hypothetical protein